MGRLAEGMVIFISATAGLLLLTVAVVVNLGVITFRKGVAKARLTTKSVVNRLSLSLSLLLVNYSVVVLLAQLSTEATA